MADEDKNYYPLPVFYFKVEWKSTEQNFSEVTGLHYEAQIIEYRHGADPSFTARKMPGLRKFGNITLKRGVFEKNIEFFTEIMKTMQLRKVVRDDPLIISLWDENHQPVITWEVTRAWPTKLTSPDLKATGNEAAIETLEIAHEGIKIT
ncbi:MAG: phage tail protein [Candidatus Methylumidiphilus sp.]